MPGSGIFSFGPRILTCLARLSYAVFFSLFLRAGHSMSIESHEYV